MNMRKLFRAALIAPTIAAPGAGMAQMHQVGPGKTVQIDAHGDCRQITNGGAHPIMIPTRNDKEWNKGPGAFLFNIDKMRGISAESCSCHIWVAGLGAGLVDDRSQRMQRIGSTALVWTASLGTGKGDGPAGADILEDGDYPSLITPLIRAATGKVSAFSPARPGA